LHPLNLQNIQNIQKIKAFCALHLETGWRYQDAASVALSAWRNLTEFTISRDNRFGFEVLRFPSHGWAL
jgi:hypothetical protein